MGSMTMALPAKKPAWQAKKNLLYEFLGATKNPSGQLKLRGKVEVDRLELKRKLTLPGKNLCRKGFQKPSQTPGVALSPNGYLIHGQVTVFPGPVKWGKWLSSCVIPYREELKKSS